FTLFYFSLHFLFCPGPTLSSPASPTRRSSDLHVGVVLGAVRFGDRVEHGRGACRVAGNIDDARAGRLAALQALNLSHGDTDGAAHTDMGERSGGALPGQGGGDRKSVV